MAVVIPVSCGGGGSDEDLPKPAPQPTPQPVPKPEEDITGLNNLKAMTLQVDKEANLLSGITFNNGASLEKTMLVYEGVTSEIADPKHFTPDYPGTCTIILTVKSKNGTLTDYKAENLTIKPLEGYTEVVIVTAEMIEELYPWYKNLQQSTKDFIYPHLLASYAACNWSKLENRAHIIQGEVPEGVLDGDYVETICESEIP